MGKWTENSALDFIFRNCDVIKTKLGSIVVKNGSAGNGSLGAIDYLHNHKKTIISIVTEEVFENMRDNKNKREEE